MPANLGDSLGIQFDENRSYKEPNKWGFLPIVQFSNERDSSAANGRSDLEVIEPFMKAYHDVMIQALQNHKIHSIPRLKMKLKDVRSFLENNFGIKDPVEYAKEGKTIKLEGKELLLFMDGEDADYIEIKSPIESTEVLLKFLFYCIVDASRLGVCFRRPHSVQPRFGGRADACLDPAGGQEEGAIHRKLANAGADVSGHEGQGGGQGLYQLCHRAHLG